MERNKTNIRHQSFKKELRAYHDSINRKNRYNLPRISGKLNMFESDTSEDSDIYEIDRKIPNTALTVLYKKDLYAIGDIDGKPVTDFKYQFIEGCLGDVKKIIRCVTSDGKIEDFSIDEERIVENAQTAQITGISTTDNTVSDVSSYGNQNDKDDSNYHEIEYKKVREQLHIPYLCGYRIIDLDKKRNRKKKYSK